MVTDVGRRVSLKPPAVYGVTVPAALSQVLLSLSGRDPHSRVAGESSEKAASPTTVHVRAELLKNKGKAENTQTVLGGKGACLQSSNRKTDGASAPATDDGLGSGSDTMIPKAESSPRGNSL